MAFDDLEEGEFASVARPLKRMSLGRSRRRISFERRLRLSLNLLCLPAFALITLLLYLRRVDSSIYWIALPTFAIAWLFAASLIAEQVIRPLQTLANVVAALREDDYSFRARGGRRNDALGDLALEINALAGMLQVQRAGAMEAMALVDRVMKSMQSPVLAFDPEGNLKLLNSAAERAFDLRSREKSKASRARLERLLGAADNELISLSDSQHPRRWVVKRTAFRLRGVPHSLFVLSDVSEALREEERTAWERLIRVLGHEINNSLTPIKSIAGSLRSRLASRIEESEEDADFARGLDVIEDRAESLNRFLQAYRELMGLPAPRLESVSLASVVRRVAELETRLPVKVIAQPDVSLKADSDQLSQALINLVRNAAEAALSVDDHLAPGNGDGRMPSVEVTWEISGSDASIVILDNGPGLSNAGNLFVPFYTTKPAGTGIGLVLAQQIALAHGGLVQLVNRPDSHGCRAEIRLPLFETRRVRS
jgi:nitrogen fixation/metabolism regulation signal transduction histidine kinase